MVGKDDELVVGREPGQGPLRARLGAVVARAREHRRKRGRSVRGQAGTLVVVVLFALMATIGAINAHGQDLRAGRDRDLVDLVRTQANSNRDLQAKLAAERAEVNKLSKVDNKDPQLNAQLVSAEQQAGAAEVTGPAVKVTLTDSPPDVQAPPGLSEDVLVVHQQDIQMVVNLFWSAGAEAMTIQGQRVISTTGVKCVGNSVVLHGIPYAPPYVITAIGDPAKLTSALNSSKSVAVYKQYVDRFQLGWKQENAGRVTMPALTGGDELKYAQPPS